MKKTDWTLYDHTKTCAENAHALGVTKSTIYAHCKKHGLPLPVPAKRGKKKGTLSPNRKIPRDADLSLSLTLLAKLYGVDTGRIVRERQRRGIKGDLSKRRTSVLRLDADTSELVRAYAKDHGLTDKDALKKLIYTSLGLPSGAD